MPPAAIALPLRSTAMHASCSAPIGRQSSRAIRSGSRSPPTRSTTQPSMDVTTER